MIRRPPRSPLFPYTPLSRSRESRRRRPPHRGQCRPQPVGLGERVPQQPAGGGEGGEHGVARRQDLPAGAGTDRKSTRLNSSHQIISYAVFCLKKKKITHTASKQQRNGSISRIDFTKAPDARAHVDPPNSHTARAPDLHQYSTSSPPRPAGTRT